jgi:hypothetical protein
VGENAGVDISARTDLAVRAMPLPAQAEGARTGPVSVDSVAVEATGLRSVLDHTSLADVLAGQLPDTARALTADPDAWTHRT